MNNWIPVSERLPEEDENVLVTVNFKGLEHIKPCLYVEVSSHIDGHWSSYSDEYKVSKDRHEVIAWMPLPKPYKEERRAE